MFIDKCIENKTKRCLDLIENIICKMFNLEKFLHLQSLLFLKSHVPKIVFMQQYSVINGIFGILLW